MMNKYSYEDALYRDIDEYVRDNDINPYTINEDALVDMLWDENDVTGNLYGYCNENEAEEYLAYNLYLAIEATEYFDGWRALEDHYERRDNTLVYLDTTIRCYLLPTVVARYLEDVRGLN